MLITEMSAGLIAEKYPDVYKEIHSKGYTEGNENGYKKGFEDGRSKGMQEGAETERKRIQEVESQSLPGHEALIKTMKYDGKTTGPEAAVQILAAEKNKLGARHAQMVEESARPLPQPNNDKVVVQGEDGAKNTNLPIEERTKQEWDKSPSLRSEFVGYESYLAFCKAEEKGLIKIYKGGK